MQLQEHALRQRSHEPRTQAPNGPTTARGIRTRDRLAGGAAGWLEPSVREVRQALEASSLPESRVGGQRLPWQAERSRMGRVSVV
jgi:hypothetical protein